MTIFYLTWKINMRNNFKIIWINADTGPFNGSIEGDFIIVESNQQVFCNHESDVRLIKGLTIINSLAFRCCFFYHAAIQKNWTNWEARSVDNSQWSKYIFIESRREEREIRRGVERTNSNKEPNVIVSQSKAASEATLYFC